MKSQTKQLYSKIMKELQ